MSARLRHAVLGAVDALGINRLVGQSKWRSKRLLILCYHGFALRDEHRWDPQLFVSRETLRGRLQYLRDHRFNVLPLGEGLRRLRAGTLPERAVAITVDDGLYDFSAVAVPLLREFSMPATLYVSTYYVEHPWPVFEVMASYLLWLGAKQGIADIELEILGAGKHGIQEPRIRRRTWERLKARLHEREAKADAKERLLQQIAQRLCVDYSDLLESRVLSLLRPAEIRALDPSLVDVQLHTHRHRVPEVRELFLREIRDNRHALVRAGCSEENLVHFCYPSGCYRPAFLPWLRESGVRSATTCEPGLATQRGDPLLLPRIIDTDQMADVDFKACASGFRAALNRSALGF